MLPIRFTHLEVTWDNLRHFAFGYGDDNPDRAASSGCRRPRTTAACAGLARAPRHRLDRRRRPAGELSVQHRKFNYAGDSSRLTGEVTSPATAVVLLPIDTLEGMVRWEMDKITRESK